ncbi:MAG: DNA repair protein RecN [Zoogloeaceae bacterium]|jgi:DNA repair protein RecN (Recombination protein N)|nr:DNA repair protein RecN [Zoogloeaceae bacterium]
MLQRLSVRDFVIVDRLELEFSSGFGALTGETGAGKSILIDALTLTLGERADPGVVRSGKEKAEVAAVFDLARLPKVRAWLAEQDFADEEELLLRRVVEAGGRSRAYINGSPASVQQLRAVGEFLVDIHGQHAHQSLLRAEAQRALLDSHGQLTALAQEVAVAWKARQHLIRTLAAAAAGSAASSQERDMLAWQIRELAELDLRAGEWPELEAEQRRLAHAASLIEGAHHILAALTEGEGACESLLASVRNRLGDMAAVDATLAEGVDALASAQAEISEVISLMRRYADKVELEPERLKEIEARQDAILNLARKHRVEVPELPECLVRLRQRFTELERVADMKILSAETEVARKTYATLAARLTAGREQTAAALGAAVSQEMRQLALASGRFTVALPPLREGAEGSANGAEQVEFRVSGLADNEARPLSKVASGGELSRISLALQVVASQTAAVPTLIFDEVDVGIGGGVAEIVGRLLRQLGETRQVLCVTHLPQVAARADWHWQVSKTADAGVIESRIAVLTAESRVEEIARMLGGVEITATTRQHARELLQTL